MEFLSSLVLETLLLFFLCTFLSRQSLYVYFFNKNGRIDAFSPFITECIDEILYGPVVDEVEKKKLCLV